MIKRTRSGRFRLYDSKAKRPLGPVTTKAKALRQERAIRAAEARRAGRRRRRPTRRR